MSDRVRSGDRPLGLAELLVWVAGLAALLVLVVEVFRRSGRDQAAGLVGGSIVLYVVYIAFSVRIYWEAPRIAIPLTMLIGGTLWTLALACVERSDLARALLSAVFIPLATAYSIRLVTPTDDEPAGDPGGPPGPSSIRSLLDKGKGFGNWSHRAPASGD